MADFDKTVVAREGRENQVYSKETGARLVAGCVCLNQNRDRILMIQSSAHKKKWVLPKGGVEKDEFPDMQKTAQRETWEEAGCLGDITKDLGIVQDMRPSKKWGKIKDFNSQVSFSNGDQQKTPLSIPRSEFHFFQMIVNKEMQEYPESHKRTRKWFSYIDCIENLEIAKRPELIECVNRSDVIKEL